jgi:hypothetical protein
VLRHQLRGLAWHASGYWQVYFGPQLLLPMYLERRRDCVTRRQRRVVAERAARLADVPGRVHLLDAPYAPYVAYRYFRISADSNIARPVFGSTR